MELISPTDPPKIRTWIQWKLKEHSEMVSLGIPYNIILDAVSVKYRKSKFNELVNKKRDIVIQELEKSGCKFSSDT